MTAGSDKAEVRSLAAYGAPLHVSAIPPVHRPTEDALPDQHRVAQAQVCPLDSGERHSEWLAQRALVEPHAVGEAMEPSGRVGDEARQRAVVWRGGVEDHAGAWCERVQAALVV